MSMSRDRNMMITSALHWRENDIYWCYRKLNFQKLSNNIIFPLDIFLPTLKRAVVPKAKYSKRLELPFRGILINLHNLSFTPLLCLCTNSKPNEVWDCEEILPCVFLVMLGLAVLSKLWISCKDSLIFNNCSSWWRWIVEDIHCVATRWGKYPPLSLTLW